MKQLLLALLLFISASIYGQTLDCKKFRNGKFKIEGNSKSPTTIFVRKGNLQTETVDNADGDFVFVVKWLNDCTYTLTPTPETLARYPGMPANSTITVKITEVRANSYLQTSTSNFSDLILSSEIIKVN